MSDFRVPKEKATVLVAAPPQEPATRYVFLSPFAQTHQGPETPSDIFNVQQRFLPLFPEEGNVELVRRDAIAWIEVAEPARREWHYFETRAGAAEAQVRVTFDTGAHLDGRVALLGPTGGQRVADVVNREEGFLHLERGEELFLVNLGRVLSITVREES